MSQIKARVFASTVAARKRHQQWPHDDLRFLRLIHGSADNQAGFPTGKAPEIEPQTMPYDGLVAAYGLVFFALPRGIFFPSRQMDTRTRHRRRLIRVARD